MNETAPGSAPQAGAGRLTARDPACNLQVGVAPRAGDGVTVELGAEELRALLAAYREVMDGSWPTLHPDMARNAAHWPVASRADLQAELAGYIRDASRPTSRVRVFWKLTPELTFGGGNSLFVADAGLSGAEELVGLDDFDPRLPWSRQAAKYREDDEEIYHGRARLDIIERQQSSAGITWVRTGKAPIRTAAGPIGIVGMYEILEPDTGRRLFTAQHQRAVARRR